MANNIVNEVNVFTLTHIVPGVVDGVFRNDPLLAYLKANGIQRIQGGAFGGAMIQENILYKPMLGRAYAPGDTFDITKRRTLEGLTFDLKHHEVNVTEFLELIEIYNRGPEAVFSLVETDLTKEVRRLQDWYKMWAVLLPPIPPLLVGCFVFFNRRAREREGVAKSRLR